MKPQVLPPNVLRHFYAGGARIAAFRGLELDGDHMPEEWIGAVNTTFGADNGRGLSTDADGVLVRDAIAADPEAWLGPEHVARYGADPALLTKLLDAGQRLPVHYHPGRAFARAAFGLDHGKTESWIILEAEPGATVWVGFDRLVELATVKEWVRSQAGDEMLAALNPVPVSAGDAILVPGGTPHAIGPGILLVELQEPTDLSLALEYRSFGLSESEASLGLDWDRALQALDRSAWDAERLAAARGPGPGANLLPPAADPYFRAERVRGGDALDAGFSVLIGLGGEGELGGEPVGRGSALLIPHAAGPLELTGDAEAIRCRPPAPNAPEGEW
jgi:mannose-6-phosphate isomerase